MSLPPPASAAELYTILITDLEDSTRLWETHPQQMEAVVIGSAQAEVAAVQRHGGLVVKSTGDGMLAVFRDAGRAVAAAIDVQRTASAVTWPGIGTVSVRVGLNTGWCKLISGDVLGRAPNLAARLQSAGHGGQILLSDATAAACVEHLPPGVELLELGSFLMRGFDGPVGVHSVAAEGLRRDFPPLRAPSSLGADLPVDETELVGRDDCIIEVTRSLAEHRLVTLWGPGGVGKTRVAVRVARAARHRFDDAIRFVELAGLEDPGSVESAAVAALRAQPLAGEDPADTLVRVLGASPALMVLDNCEHVLPGVRRTITRVLRACRGAHVLATSREPIGVDGERTIEVRTLATPTSADLTVLTGSPAVQLFVSRVAQAVPGFALSSSSAATVAAICRATDGLPLAIELAAGRAAVEGLHAEDVQPGARWSSDPHGHGVGEDEVGLTRSLWRTRSALSAEEADLLGRLAVFSGPFRREMALAMSASDERAEAHLRRLLRTAMIQRDDAIPPAYRMLVPMRDLAWSRLDDRQRASATSAHAVLMLDRATAIEPQLRTGSAAAAVAALSSEFDEHRVAFGSFVGRGAIEDAARLVLALFQFCLFQPRPEGHQWATIVADRLTGDEDGAAEIIGAAALAAWFAGNTTDAVARGRRAIAVAEATGGSARWARTALVDALSFAGDVPAAVPHFVALVEDLTTDDDPFWQINGLGLESLAMTMVGRTDAAIRRAEAALTRARRLGSPDGMHWGFYALGRALAANDPVAAGEAFDLAMRAAREVDSRFHLGIDLVEWVAVERRLDHRSMAVAGAIDLLDLLATSGNRAQLSQALHACALLLADAGRHEQAAVARLARRGLPSMPPSADDRVAGSDEDTMSRLETELGDVWPRLRMRAVALTEAELIAHCRAELVDLQHDVGS